MYIISKQLFAKRFADQFLLLLEFPRAGTVSDSSPHVHEIHSLRSAVLRVLGLRASHSRLLVGLGLVKL
jgi:hypothetical protein